MSQSRVCVQAAQWAARLDRGLSPGEQDAYFQWLRDNPVNGRAIAQLRSTWNRLDALARWRPTPDRQPNPDLLAPKRRRFRISNALVVFAACLAVATILVAVRPGPSVDRHAAQPALERRILPDGSQVELNHGAKIDVHYGENSRVVHLQQGEAHFSVAKDPAKPFLVVTKVATVRATGTAFTTHLGADAVAVLVTEGSVRLERPDAVSGPRALLDLTAGQEAIVRTSRGTLRLVELKVRDDATESPDRPWAWRTARLYFYDLPLLEVVAELNRFSSRKLVIGDPETANLLIGGNFKTDNPGGFARLLVEGFDVETTDRGTDIVLFRRR